VWKNGENLFSGFKCKYCLKEFRGGGGTSLKEHLAGKGGNISRCRKCPPDIRNYFLRELQRIRERKKAIKEERFHRVQDTMPLSDDEDEELHETVEDQNSPTYEESNDSSSKTDNDDANDGDDTGGGTASLAAQEIAHEQPLSPFTADQFTHCT
jgi:hypothetical protein